MSDIVLKVENLWKQYRLGVMGAGTLRDDIAKLWAKLQGKEDPTLEIGSANTLSEVEGEYVWALQDISFDVKRGEVLGIIGKNGAGKSTLLKILSKVTAPTRGDIRLKGRVASLLEVGTGFHPELTGRENIFLNGAILGMTKAEIRKKLDEIVDFAGVAKYVDTPTKRYSSGMRVRLGFAVAAFLEPEILIVDEVLAVGDAEFQKKAIGKMQDVSQGEGRTVLFVSHNMSSVQGLCSKLLLLQQGKVQFMGDVREGIDTYLTVQSKGKGAVDLRERREDRYGKQNFSRFLAIRTLNEKQEEIAIFKSQGKMFIELTFELKERVTNLEIGCSISSATGVTYGGFLNTLSNYQTLFEQGQHSVVVEIVSLHLYPGIFHLNVWLKKQAKTVDDQIIGAIEFDVVYDNVLKHTNFVPKYISRFGVIVDNKWHDQLPENISEDL